MSISAPVKLTIKDYKSELHNDWCPGCVAPATRILTRSGSAPIAEIKVDDDVLGHDGKYHRVTEVMSHWHEASMQRVTLSDLGSLTLTADHPVYVAQTDRAAESMRYGWIPAGTLRVG